VPRGTRVAKSDRRRLDQEVPIEEIAVREKERFLSSLCLPLLSFAIGCASASPASTDSDPSDTPGVDPKSDAGTSPAASPPPVLRVLPADTYSGYDGTHVFRVPVAVYGAKEAKLVPSDASMVDVQPAKLVDTSMDDGVYFIVRTKKVGTVKLTAQAGGGSASATLTIAPYTLDEYQVGAQRYTNAASSGPACVSCHAASGGIDHSPSRMASAKDSDVVSVITTGILVEGNPITQVRHKWAVSDAEAAGLVSYLRALAPRGFVGLQ
jgi:mono/diheme cytochrome c family protein